MKKDFLTNSSLYPLQNNDEFYKMVRLKTGETILCSMSSDIKSVAGESHLCLIEPVQLIPQQQSRRNGQVVGETFLLRPWMGMSDSDEFVIATDIVLTIGNLKHEVKKQYISYISQAIETKKKSRENAENEEAVIKLLHDVTPGEVRIVDEDDIEYFFYEEDYDEEG